MTLRKAGACRSLRCGARRFWGSGRSRLAQARVMAPRGRAAFFNRRRHSGFAYWPLFGAGAAMRTATCSPRRVRSRPARILSRTNRRAGLRR